jgi:hypothetical protein
MSIVPPFIEPYAKLPSSFASLPKTPEEVTGLDMRTIWQRFVSLELYWNTKLFSLCHRNTKDDIRSGLPGIVTRETLREAVAAVRQGRYALIEGYERQRRTHTALQLPREVKTKIRSCIVCTTDYSDRDYSCQGEIDETNVVDHFYAARVTCRVLYYVPLENMRDKRHVWRANYDALEAWFDGAKRGGLRLSETTRGEIRRAQKEIRQCVAVWDLQRPQVGIDGKFLILLGGSGMS